MRIEVALCHQVHDGTVGDAIGHVCGAEVGAHTGFIKGGKRAGGPVDHQRFAIGVAQEKAVFGRFGVGIHQHWRIGVAGEVIEVDLACLHQFVNERQDEKPISSGGYADPVIGHGIVTRANRVHANDTRAARLDPANAHLDRIAVMVFGYAEKDEKLGMVPIRLAKFPEGTAHGVDACRRHVDRAKAAVRCVVWRAEILRPKAGERLRLIASGEKREL